MTRRASRKVIIARRCARESSVGRMNNRCHRARRDLRLIRAFISPVGTPRVRSPHLRARTNVWPRSGARCIEHLRTSRFTRRTTAGGYTRCFYEEATRTSRTVETRDKYFASINFCVVKAWTSRRGLFRRYPREFEASPLKSARSHH